jgi:hypothetical protein
MLEQESLYHNKLPMKKLLILLSLFASLSQADENLTIDILTAQTNDLNLIIGRKNQEVCVKFSAAGAPNCSQAQACTAASATGGASCTAAQARAANARIYPQTNAGRTEFVKFEYAAPRFINDKLGLADWHNFLYCTYTYPSQNQTQRDAICTSRGQSAGCPLC